MYGGIEMKKIALTLLSLFLITPCLANIHINPSTVESVVKEFVPADKVVSVISEYNNQLKQSNGTGISAQKLWNICAIAGWDIKKPNGKSQCQKFVNALVKKSSIKFYHACAKENKGKAGYICVDDFFTNKIYGGTQVNLTPGQTLAREYARLKHNDSTVQCKNKFDPGTLDDTLMCTSHNQNAYYEFVFDDLEEPKDQIIKNSIQNAICRMYDAKPTTAGCAGGGTNVSGTATCWDASCAADSAKCAKINQSMAKFGYIAEYKNGKCEINFNTVTKQEDLKTAYGIDNFVFCHGIQVANAPNVETYLKQYVAERAGVSASSVKCESGFNTYTGTGCARNGITDFKDDIKTCRVGNNQIDFVFNDINEKIEKTVEGGVQGMSCIVTGGTYSGERCIGLGEQQCNILRQSNLKECPECRAAKWDPDTESCVLPSSADAQNLQKGVNITLIAGGAIAGVVITVATFGGFAATAAAAGAVATGTATAAQTTAIVFTSLETIGGVIELNQQYKINGIADDFLVESNKCKNATCAKKMLAENLQRMANLQNDMTAAEADAVDTEMARLANLIPDDDEIWATMLVNGTDMADNKAGFWESWEPEQVWRAVGIGLQLASLITGITKWAISKSSRIAKSTAAIKQKFARAIQSIDNAPESTLRAKQLALKQRLERDALQKRIAQGKIVHNADDILLQIPKTRLAAEVATSEGKLTGLTGKTKYGVVNMLDDWMTKNGSSVIVQYDKNMKAVYTAGIQDNAMPGIEQWLRTNRVPYSKNGNYIRIMETDLENVGGFVRSADDPIITKIVNTLDDDAYMRAVDNAIAPNMDDKTAERAMEKAAADIMQQREYVSKVFKDAIDPHALQEYASRTKQQYLHIIATDEDLALDALRFDELSTAQKQEFANKIIRKYNAGVCDGGTCQMNTNITTQLRRNQVAGDQRNGIIRISEDTAANGLDDFMDTLSHENNHFHDEHAAGFLNYEQARLASNTAGDFTTDIDVYNMNLTEHASSVIGRTVGTNFTSDLINLIERLYQ